MFRLQGLDPQQIQSLLVLVWQRMMKKMMRANPFFVEEEELHACEEKIVCCILEGGAQQVYMKLCLFNKNSPFGWIWFSTEPMRFEKRYSCQRNTQTYFIQNLSCSHEIFSSEYSLPFNQFHLHYYGRLLAAVLRLLRKKYCSLEDKPIFLKCIYVFKSCSILIIFNPSLSRTKESSYKYSKHFIMRSYLYIYTRQFICICIYRC